MRPIRAWALGLGLLLSSAVAVAQEDAAESRSATFQAVQGNVKEDVPGGPLLIAAYGTILVVLCAYVARLGLLQRKNGEELERLARAVERAGRPG
ncbi:MAG TPA: hypothetical protein VFX59_00760 [Polyangiales bacterium]|nr:hypothetical protein [Polyangiales bacterium]